MGKQVIYRQKVDELRQAIREGRYDDGPFPSEAQLMRKFGVGRQTAIRILNELEGEGLIKQGVALNRKSLSEIAIHDPAGFKVLVEIAKK